MVYKDIVRKFALENASRFNGKANPGKIIGKVVGENPEFKDKLKEIKQDILDIVNEVNKLTVEQQIEELKRIAPELLEKKPTEKKTDLKDLENAEDGKVVMRFEPSPSGPMHIGHSYVFGLNYLYAKKYNGKLILRVSDTNPENIYEPSYNLIKEDGGWLTNNSVTEFMIQSERLQLYYDYALKLIEEGHAYICECDSEDFRSLVQKCEPCPCRELSIEEQSKRWRKMFEGYAEGDAVFRIKTDIKDKNPAMRDFPALRINESEHPKQGKKFRVWPLMNFSVAIDDAESGVTHTLRGKDHADNAKRQAIIHSYLNHKTPIAISVGRINFEGFPVSCSKTKPLIEDGTYSGWDDIRIPFLPALKRRGIQPNALLRYCIEVGVTRNDKSVHIDEFFKTIHAFNKEIIDPNANRYFFVADPVKITIQDAPNKTVEMDLHPDNKKGGRTFNCKDSYFIAKEDYDCIQDGEEVRLRDCLNFKKQGEEFIYTSCEHDKFSGKKLIHWIPEEENYHEAEVLMYNNKTVKGIVEREIEKLQDGEVCQFERFGFVRLDSSDQDHYKLWFTHK
jgi:glutamyl-tRNA synthetase